MSRRSNRSWSAIGALLTCMGLAAGAQAQSAFISEVFVNPPSTDNGFESIEITGTPGLSLDGWVLVAIEGDGAPGAGVVDAVISLNGMSLGTNGILLLRDSSTTLVPAPDAGTNVVVMDFNPDIENGTITFVLGMGTFPGVTTDLDADNDGTIDAPVAGFTAVDAVAYQDGNSASDSEYADDFGFAAGNLGTVSPDAIYRILGKGNTPLSWAGGDITGANPGPYNWSAFNFGWDGVGIPDPTLRTLDLGTLNYVFQAIGSGACCFPNGSCMVLAAADCAAQGGAYQGDNVECGVANCPQPQGACCFFDSTCSVTTAIICGAQGGVYQGDNTTCSPSPCPQPQGACCFGDGTCAVIGELDCAAAGGFFNGIDTICENVTCTPATPGDLYLSEVFFNSPGGDNGNESIEIVGPPNFSLDGWFFLVIEGDGSSSGGTGALDQKVSLRGMTTGSNGILLIRDAAIEIAPAPAAGTNVVVFDFTPDIENNSNTFVLGYGRLDPAAGTDLDTNDDGIIDVALGAFTAVDAVAYGDPSRPPSIQYAGEFGGENLGDVTPLAPGALYRILDTSLQPFSWAGGFTTGTAPGPFTWSATSNFGWAAVGIADPSTRTLDLGTLNYVFDETTGACCLADGSCNVLTAAACAEQGGTYQGDATTCETTMCPQPCACDFNSDDILNSQDFFDFLTAFFANQPSADYNGDMVINSQDFFDFLTCFFAPPAGC